MGDAIEVVTLPNDSTPHYREGIFASDGNFAFDQALLVVESYLIRLGLLFVFLAIAMIIMAIRKKRRALSPQ